MDKVTHVYAVGDSFTFGDDLLDFEAITSKKLQELRLKTNINSFSLIEVGQLWWDNFSLFKEITEIKDSLTYAGKIAKHYNAELLNFASPGASMETIVFQLHLVLQDIAFRKLQQENVFILVGLTTYTRKFFINTDPTKHQPPSFPLTQSYVHSPMRHCVGGSIMIANPQYSMANTKPLAEAIGKYITNDQLVIEFYMHLINIQNLITSNKIKFIALNIWQPAKLQITESQWVVPFYSNMLATASADSRVFPGLDKSLTMIKLDNKIKFLTGQHPPPPVHTEWAKYIIAEIEDRKLKGTL